MTLKRLILLPDSSALPATFLTFDAAGTVMERGRLSLDAPRDLPALPTVAIAPGAEVLVRWLDLPAGGGVQQRAAALWRLRDELATRAERTTVALGPIQPGRPRLAAAVDTALLTAWREHLEALGVPADVIAPDCLAAPEPEGSDIAHVVVLGPHRAVRAQGLAATVQAEIEPLIRGDRQAVLIEDAQAVEALLIQTALNPPINLLDDGRADRAARKGWMRAAALAAALLVSPLVLTGAAGLRDNLAADRAEAQARATAVRTAPDLAGSDDPAADLRDRLETAPPPGGALNALAAVVAAVEGVPGAAMENLSLAPDTGLRVGMAYPAFQDLETLRRAVAPAGLALTELSTTEDQGRVVSDLVVEAAR
ncbi:MAG: hypothetical protein KF910_01505 [Brevundimonas sp.]|uniref:type II secretion system protein GspL n=1 Tax=Brevundimonas sp. TaxID=1871086 RepID=UPI0025BD6123|nr:type II secretion system protein GspL [Brevundimonas sp.]MBX3476259.1 hypothetical protein [Brevundimonas sp.]